jgi:hypothetical protein
MQFYLFILLNAVLFVRPAEIVPEWEGAPIYEVVILACLAVSAAPLLQQLTTRSLATRPVSVCVLGLLAAVVLSHLANANLYEARLSGAAFGKIVLYYLLLVGVVNSEARLRQFLGWLGCFIVIITVLGLLQYHGAIHIPALEVYQQGEITEDGEYRIIPRLCGMGIFNDPNDLSLVLVWGVMICLHRSGERGFLRLLWVVALGVVSYALSLTQSRGGFLALLVSLLLLLRARFRGWKVWVMTALVLPVILVLFAGRQTKFDVNDTDDTSQHRIRLWSEGLVLFQRSPLFGIGMGQYVEEVGQVAHNSFIHGYTELGCFGGSLFLGAFVYSLATLRRLGSAGGQQLPPSLRHLRPYLLAMVAGMVAGMMSLSRVYNIPTYLTLGIATVYFRLASVSAPSLAPRVSQRLVLRLLFLGVLFYPVAYLIVRLLVRWD